MGRPSKMMLQLCDKVQANKRWSKLTPQKLHQILSDLQDGMSIALAAKGSGISPHTFRDWIQESQDPESPFFGLQELVGAAQTASARKAIQKVRQSQDWKAHAWVLEHAHKEDFHKAGAAKLEITGKDGAPIEISAVEKAVDRLKETVGSLSDDDLERILNDVGEE